MSRYGLVLTAATMVAAMTLTACASEVTGTPAAGPTTAAAATTTTEPAASGPPEQRIAQRGECVAGNDPAPVDCAKPHTVEITMAGSFGGAMPDEPPSRDAVFEAVFPTCRAEAAKYLGDERYDMTTLAAWLLWAGADDWRAGARWYRCGVARLGPDGRAVSQTGSVKDALVGNGINDFRLCTKEPPSKTLPAPVACDQPHRSEAVAVIAMGDPRQPLPAAEEFERTARTECGDALRRYLAAARDDVSVAWHQPDRLNWRHGFNNLTCYAETKQPVTASLRDIGTAPLPN